MGGNVAECAGGLRAVKYGVTRDYVLGLEVVLPTGRDHPDRRANAQERCRVRSDEAHGRVRRHARHRDEDHPEAAAAARERPDACPHSFQTIESAASAASAVIAGRILPRALEFVDRAALRAVENYLKEDISGGAAAMLLVEVDGAAEVDGARDQARARRS